MDDNARQDELLMPHEVAAMFRVNPKTVSRWEHDGKLHSIRTLGGHRRFRRGEVERAIATMRRAGDESRVPR